jgi:transposase
MTGEAMDHEDRRQRRFEMARAVKAGQSKTAVARRYEVSRSTVSAACLEFGGIKSPATPQYAVIAALQNGDAVPSIAERFGLSKQRVYQIRDKCIEHGVILGKSEIR